MQISINNEHGVISINESYFKQILYESVKEFEGKVWFAKYDGKQNDLQIILGQFDQLYKLELNDTPKGFDVNVYIIVQFGISLSSVSKSILNALRKCLENDLAYDVYNINVYVSALLSKKGIVKKDLVYKLYE